MSILHAPLEDPDVAMVWFCRTLSVVFLLTAIVHWAVVLGLLQSGGVDFFSMSTSLQVAVVIAACLEPVAAVGLWLMAPWGTVLWLITVVMQIVMHTSFVSIFGTAWAEIAFHAVSVACYAYLLWRTHQPGKKETKIFQD